MVPEYVHADYTFQAFEALLESVVATDGWQNFTEIDRAAHKWTRWRDVLKLPLPEENLLVVHFALADCKVHKVCFRPLEIDQASELVGLIGGLLPDSCGAAQGYGKQWLLYDLQKGAYIEPTNLGAQVSQLVGLCGRLLVLPFVPE